MPENDHLLSNCPMIDQLGPPGTTVIMQAEAYMCLNIVKQLVLRKCSAALMPACARHLRVNCQLTASCRSAHCSDTECGADHAGMSFASITIA
jgi:hypothetical protein